VRKQGFILMELLVVACVAASVTSCGCRPERLAEPPVREPIEKPAPVAKPLAGELIVTYEYPNYSLPFVVALERGFFREEGLEVIPRKIGTGDTLDIAQVEVVNGHDFYLLKEGRGAVLAVHPFSRKSDFAKAMLLKKSANIADWKDFKGKSVVITDLSDFSLLNEVFTKHGLKALGQDVTIVSGGGAIAGFPKDRDRHALYGSSSTVLPLMRQYPKRFEIRWKDLGKESTPECPLVACSYVKASLLPKKDKALAAYVRAIDRAIDLVRQEPDAAVQVLPKYFDVDKEWTRNMEVFEFHKSDEVFDDEALSSKLGIDVSDLLLDLSKN